MNNKAEGEVLLIIIFALLILAALNNLGNTSYQDYMRDCKNNYEENFLYDTECYNFFNEKSYNCSKVNETELEIFCQNKWDGTLNNGEEE